MELDELKEIWKGYEAKLDKSLAVNQHLFEQLRLDQTRSKMRSLLYSRIAEAVCFFILLVALGGYIANHLSVSAPILSAIILTVFVLIGLIGSIGQIALIGMLDYSGSVRDIQKQLFRIRSHKLQLLRLILLSIPFYMAYILLGFDLLWNIDLYTVADPTWLEIQIMVSLLLVGPVLWFYRALGLQDTTRPWVTKIVRSLGDSQISEALELLNELEELSQEGST